MPIFHSGLPPSQTSRLTVVPFAEVHFDHFEQVYDQRFAKDYGFFRPVISDVIRAYLKCGDLKEGFARVRCPDCNYKYLLAFSCRGRWFCPSCHAKKVVQFGEVLREYILFPVPHRQYVFSIPIILRKFFLYNRSLLSNLAKCAADSLLRFLCTTLGLEDGICGAVMRLFRPLETMPNGTLTFTASLLTVCSGKEVSFM